MKITKLSVAIISLVITYSTSTSAQNIIPDQASKAKIGQLLLKDNCKEARIFSISDLDFKFFEHVTRWCDREDWLKNQKKEMFAARLQDVGAALGDTPIIVIGHKSAVDKTRERFEREDQLANPLQRTTTAITQAAFREAIIQTDCAMAMAISVEAEDLNLASIAKDQCQKLKAKRGKDTLQRDSPK